MVDTVEPGVKYCRAVGRCTGIANDCRPSQGCESDADCRPYEWCPQMGPNRDTCLIRDVCTDDDDCLGAETCEEQYGGLCAL